MASVDGVPTSLVGPTATTPPADGRELIGSLLVFADLDAAGLDALAASVEWLSVPAGTRLFSVGDPPDGMYGLVAGRVRFFAEYDGRAVLTAEAEPGITFGEGSLLVGGGRSRTAVAVRDSLVVRLPPEVFSTLMGTSPQVARAVAGMLAARTNVTHVPRESATTTVLVGAVSPADVEWFATRLARHVGVAVVSGEPDAAHASSARLVTIGIDDPGVAATVRRADRVLLVAGNESRLDDVGRISPVAATGADPLTAPPVELVLLDGAHGRPPAGPWLASGVFSACHHVRRRADADVQRIARHLAGRAIGLVLGGGGARGMAHIGVVKALAELGIPIDHVGGSSMGAIIGGQIAMGWTWEEMLAHDEREWASRRLRLDVTLPTVSVSSGRRARRILETTFGTQAIEDLTVPFFCTTVNLSRFHLAVHHEGPAAHWILASASAPGLWPPVVDGRGELHIDGGQLNNVPTDVMRAEHSGPVIAVDVCALQSPMTVPRGSQPPVGLRHLLRRRSSARYPSLVDTLNRCALLGSLQQRETASEQADVYLTPDLASVGFSGFGRIHEAVEIGYTAAMEALSDWRPS